MLIQKFAQKGLVINKKGEVLLIKYLSGKFQDKTIAGKFALPGGKIEFGETPDNSLIKEIKEETGVKCKPGLPVYCWNWEYKKGEDHVQINAVARVCKYVSGKLIRLKEEKESVIEYCIWTKVEDVVKLDFMKNEIPALRLFLQHKDFYLSQKRHTRKIYRF